LAAWGKATVNQSVSCILGREFEALYHCRIVPPPPFGSLVAASDAATEIATFDTLESCRDTCAFSLPTPVLC